MERKDDSVLSTEVIRRRSGQFDLASIQWLDLSDSGIREITSLEPCVCLKTLNLSKNKIQHGGCLSYLPQLTDLDLTENFLRNLSGLEEMPSIQILKLQGNDISDIRALDALSKLPSLRALYLQDLGGGRKNPVCDHPGYAATIWKLLPELDTLDGEHSLLRESAQAVYRAEAEAAGPGALDLPPSLPWTMGMSWDFPEGPTASLEATTARRISRDVHDAISECYQLDKDAKRQLARLEAKSGK